MALNISWSISNENPLLPPSLSGKRRVGRVEKVVIVNGVPRKKSASWVMVRCPECTGIGRMSDGQKQCRRCEGSGKVEGWR